ncbi:potassium-transporting ATPase subunit KdpA [Pseudactinotalea suaedae]|uniref:potassium-transporting ATPase subunit KdpA n=1 Tax=Pseudactinotalea suaedae TaxID=1524924 RepID=UPI0012E28CE0|nr:potassium-transporting ATPase subunit KdpA [Pseudactinotalea suaedae]
MSDTLAGLLTIGAVVLVLAAVYVPLGDYMARVFERTSHSRLERALYRVGGVDPDAEQSPRQYAVAVLAFSGVCVVALMALLMGQAALPMSRELPGVGWDTALNTAVSFVTNTNWQSYAGESTLGFTAQMAGLAVQNFLSAAVGLTVAVALVRGFTRSHAGTIGNFWVDLVRGTLRLLLPIAVLGALALMAGGVVQNLADTTATGVTGAPVVVPGGPVASQESIKLLGTNGGGFFNANSAHPLENPTALTNLLQVLLILVIPISLTRTLGTLLDNRRQARTILGVMLGLLVGALALTTWAEVTAQSDAARAAGAAMEGKESRFGVWASALFAVVTTGTSTGAVNASHDSMTPLGGGVVLLNMLIGEVSPGGVGSGLYGMLMVSILTVFLCGLMVGRTPELLGKRIGKPEMTCVALYTLTSPVLVLLGTGVAMALPPTLDAMGNPGQHGFTEVLYAYASAANNNGSAFGGLTVTSTFFQVTLAIATLLGRLVPIVLVLMLAGRLARQGLAPRTSGTLPTDGPLFAGVTTAVVLVVGALTFFPALVLGPVAEALS